MATANEKFQVKKPALDREVLVQPEYRNIAEDFQANIDLLNSKTIIFGRPLKEIRQEIQSEMCDLLGLSHSGSFVATGHQPVFHHCGILAKFFLAEKLACDVSGKVFNFIIDTDIISPELALPGKSENGNSINNIPLLVNNGKLTAEFQLSPSSWEMKRFRNIFDSEYIIPKYEQAAENLVKKIEAKANSTKTISELISMINLNYAQELGLNRYDIPSSKASGTTGFLNFVFNIVNTPQKTWEAYNQAIDEFEKLEHPHKSPIPRLNLTDGSLEMPFWMVLPGTPRMPMYIRLSDMTLTCGGKQGQVLAIQLPDDATSFQEKLEDTALKIRPKAVTFTCFTRLFFADYFIHGIGGAYYDKVTDNFIKNYFDIEPPAYGCTSATILPDFGNETSLEQAQNILNKAIGKLRDFESNPQKYVSFEDNTTEVEDLLRQKMILVEKNNLFRETRAPRHEREVVFNEIKEINNTICKLMPDIRQKIEAEITSAKKNLKSAQAGQYRELFFGLFEPEMLKQAFSELDSQ